MSRYSNLERENYYKEDATSRASEQMEPETKNGVVKGIPWLRLRVEPGVDEETLKIVPEGTKVEIVEQQKKFAPKEFIKVRLLGDPKEYWTKEKYIR